MAVTRRLIEINGMFLLLERRGTVVYRRLVRTVGGKVPLRGGECCLRLVVTTLRGLSGTPPPFSLFLSSFIFFPFPSLWFVFVSFLLSARPAPAFHSRCSEPRAAVAFQVSRRCGFPRNRSPVTSTPVMELFF